MVTIPQSVLDDIIDDAESSLPDIACGVLAGSAEEVLEYFPCSNVSTNAEAQFEIDPGEMLDIQRESCERYDVILGICYSEPRAAAYPSTEAIRNWLPTYLCFVLSIQDSNTPELKAFRIHAERVTEQPIQIVDTHDSGQWDDAREVASSEEDDGEDWEEEEESPQPEFVSDPRVVHEVRRHFFENRYLGWNYWLTALNDARSRSDWDTCIELTTELERGYDLNSDERRRCAEICDWALFQSGGLDAIWTHYNRRLQAGAADPDAHFRLALVFERQGSYEAAREHFRTCLAASQGSPSRILVESALHALAEEQQSGTEHPFFATLWQTVAGGPQEPAKELGRVVREVLEGADWRHGCEVVSALESLGDADSLGKAFASPSPPVRVAVAAALRRMNRELTASILGEAMSASSPLVRWQATRHFAQNGPSAAPVLLRALKEDPDVSVRIAAVEGLARSGGRDAIPALRQAPPWTDALGESLQQAAFAAIQQIEIRYPPPPPPRLPVRSANEAQQFLAAYLLLTGLLVILGALPVFLLHRWASAGYLLYAWFVRRVFEPYHSPCNFFADKPCYTGLRSSRPPTRGLRRALNISLLNFPLWFTPPLTLSILWLSGWSWGKFAVTLFGGVAGLLMLAARGNITTVSACKYCTARERCPRWRFRFEPFFKNMIKAARGSL